MESSRREILKMAGGAALVPVQPAAAAAPPSDWEWIRSNRTLIAEAYNPPFYPTFEYRADRAVEIARRLNCDSLRYPAASYYANFPTQSGYPVHPQMKGDPMRETLELLRGAGLRSIAYLPLNHAFMDVTSRDPRYAGWMRRDAAGQPLVTGHYGFGEYFEGCLNSPLREVITALVRETLTHYPFDVMYFDGPYQGMAHGGAYCHCEHCEAAYRKRFGKPVPDQRRRVSLDDTIQYEHWMTHDVVLAFFREIREMIRRTRPVPVLFNDTALLGPRQWRSRGVAFADGFMFEAASTPEDKLFNLQLGRSTGKVIWTYLGGYTSCSRDHLKDPYIRGWYSYPVESQELLMDGAVASAAAVGCVYWGLQRLFYGPEDPLQAESGRSVKQVYDFHAAHAPLLRTLQPRPQAGILVSTQTIDWFDGSRFVRGGYANYYRGAYHLLKSLSIESEPFLDWELSPQRLARYRAVFAPNAACLSAAQCEMLSAYVRNGGLLIATHLTSSADEYGRPRGDFALADLFGASLAEPEPLESPDLYLRFPDGRVIPQDPQIVRLRRTGGEVLAETIDRGRRRNLGPSVLRHATGGGHVLYIGSGLEAVYQETLLAPVREFFDSLLAPFLAAGRSYEMPYTPGVTPHYMDSGDTLLLHLLADTGDKNKRGVAREHFLPVSEIRVRIRVARPVKRVSLLRSETRAQYRHDGAWLEVAVPSVRIHEAIRIDLA